nr:putative tetrameric tRNA splicing endonuclease [Cryptomonas sp.]
MDRKLPIWTTGFNFFFSEDSSHILTLRNEFRVYGNLINISSSIFYQNFCAIFSVEEILIGIEFGFITIKKMEHREIWGSNYFCSKFLSNKIFNLKKKLMYRQRNTLNPESKSELIIRYWRETTFLNSKIFKKKSILNFNRIKFLNNTFREKVISLKSFIYKLKIKDFYKYEIFRDLWQRGFIIACGIKFGATYLIYAGEINEVHASSSIIVSEIPPYIYPSELISFGRVGTITKKRSLLASILEDLSVNYIGLKWNKYLP